MFGSRNWWVRHESLAPVVRRRSGGDRMMPTDAIAPWFALVLLALAILTRLAWRAKWRRDDRRQKALAAGIADERRTEWIPARPGQTPGQLVPGEDDEMLPDPVLDEITEEVPVVTLREESIPTQWVSFGPRWMHKTCLEARRDGRRPCAECAPHLVTGAR